MKKTIKKPVRPISNESASEEDNAKETGNVNSPDLSSTTDNSGTESGKGANRLGVSNANETLLSLCLKKEWLAAETRIKILKKGNPEINQEDEVKFDYFIYLHAWVLFYFKL